MIYGVINQDSVYSLGSLQNGKWYGACQIVHISKHTYVLLQ